MKLQLIAYAAGLFDGEGYITISVQKRRIGESMQVVAGIAMTDPSAIVLMAELFGGSLFKGGARPNPRHKPLHSWNISSQNAYTFLKTVRPFLLIKSEEADIALEFQRNINEWNHKLGNRYRLSPKREEVFAYRRHLADRLRQLKSRVKPFAT